MARRKRAYFFIIDSIVALTILSVGIIIIYSFHERQARTEQPYTISADVLTTLSYNKVKNVDNDYAGPNSVLTRDGNITDIDKTLLEQAAEFYYRSDVKGCPFCLSLLADFLGNITNNLIPREYQYVLRIENVTVYNHSTEGSGGSSFIIPARAIVHGIYNGTELYGPYLAEVVSWG